MLLFIFPKGNISSFKELVNAMKDIACGRCTSLQKLSYKAHELSMSTSQGNKLFICSI